jgi:hypothetical protein
VPVAACALVLGITGCGGDGGPRDEEVIRGWVQAVSAGRYERAAGYFAPGAIVEQVEEIRLDTTADAVAFNRALPCRADLTDVEDEGDTSLAAFRLRRGPGGPCEGAARVRFTIRDGLIREWRQLPEAPAPPGAST